MDLNPAGQAVADTDPIETAEWRDALQAVVAQQGAERARFLLGELQRAAQQLRVSWNPPLNTPYVNTIAAHEEPTFPGDLGLEAKLNGLVRWNAMAMVARANKIEMGGSAELGGHIASYASAADLFEVGFNHFFHAPRWAGSRSVTAATWCSSSRTARTGCVCACLP